MEVTKCLKSSGTLDNTGGRVAQRTAGAVDLVDRWRELFEQQHRALAGQRRICSRHALDLADGLVQAFYGRASALPPKRVAPKAGPEVPGMGGRRHQPLARRSSGVLPAASAALNQSGRLPIPPQVWP